MAPKTTGFSIFFLVASDFELHDFENLRIFDAWHGPEACSIEGGGLTNLHPNASWMHVDISSLRGVKLYKFFDVS